MGARIGSQAGLKFGHERANKSTEVMLCTGSVAALTISKPIFQPSERVHSQQVGWEGPQGIRLSGQ